MDEEVWKHLVRFIRREVGLSDKTKLRPESTLVDDLGQTGDDADILMTRFFESFKVDRGDFDFHQYFLMEGEGLLYAFIRRTVLRKPHTFKREPIDLRMLYEAIQSGRWQSEQLAALK